MSLKLDCPKRELSEAMNLAINATRQSSPNPIYQNFKLDASGTGVRILSCDGEMWVVRDLSCMVHDGGSVCIQAKHVTELVNQLPEGDVQLSLSDSQGMLVQLGASEYRVPSRDAEEFPEPPEFGGEGELTMNMGDLREAIDAVLFAVSSDPHRPILTGVQFNYDGNRLTLVATDTHRLAVRRIAQEGIGTSLQAVLPDKALRAIKSLPVAADSPITLKFGNGRMGVEVGGAKVVAQLLSGAYPNWERVVPTEYTRVWTVEKDQIVDNVKRSMIVARDSANRLTLRGSGDSILIRARSEDKGEAKEEVPMVPTNGDIEIAFNGQYVLNAITPIKGAGVRIEMTENSRPAVVRSADDGESYFCVIMPMSLS